MRRSLRGAAALAVPLFLSACSPAWRHLDEAPPGAVQVAVTLPRGGPVDCGPEALAAIFALHGRPEDVDAISKLICDPARGGTNVLAMSLLAVDRGFQAAFAPGATLDLLRATLDTGTPPIVMVRLLPFALYHYFVVVGFQGDDVVCARQGGGVTLIARDRFLALWNGAARWTLVIAPSLKAFFAHDAYHAYLRQVPDSPIPFEVFDATYHYRWGTVFEEMGHPRLARIQYERALAKDPSFVAAALDLGNLHFRQGDPRSAVEAFRLGAHAGSACANNLAFLLSESFGRHDLAALWAQRARAQAVPGGELLLDALDTSATIAMKRKRFREAEEWWVEAASSALGAERLEFRRGCWAGAARAARAQGKGIEGRVYEARAGQR